MNYPLIRNIAIDEIVVENRRREDFGDIEGLAESIRRFGLFHPLIVDDKSNLVAGERRLRALKLLEWSEVPARLYRDLTDDERNEIELEENLRRKDLTAIEISRQIVRQAKQIAPLISLANEGASRDMGLVGEDLISGHSVQKLNPIGAGRKPTYEVPRPEVAKALGLNEKTLRRAEQHVEAVEKYPEIVSVPTQKDAIKIAKTLDAVDDKKQKEIRADLAQGKIGEVTKIVEEHKRDFEKGQNPSVNFADTIYKIHRTINSINLHGGISYIWREWSKQERIAYHKNTKDLAEKINNFIQEMEAQLNETGY